QGRRNIRSTGLSIRQRELLRSAGKVSLHNAAALLREAEFAVRLVEWTTIRSASRQLLDAGNDIVLIERTDREWLSDLSRHHQSAFRRRLAHKHEPVGWRNQESATGSSSDGRHHLGNALRVRDEPASARANRSGCVDRVFAIGRSAEVRLRLQWRR